jgi:hypothetical protein
VKTLGAWLLLVVAVVLLGASGVASCAVRDQLQRDRECAANIQQHVRRIEAFRTKNGRLPRRDELRGGGMSIIDYRVASGPLGTTTGADQYELTFWHGEWSVHYASATGQNTCDSGALRGAGWIAALLLIPGIALLFLGQRTLRARATPRAG